VPGDVGSDDALRSIAKTCSERPLRALVHTAGLSPSTGPWEQILETNLVATARLLDALDPMIGNGFAAALIASMARLVVPAPPAALLELLEDPLADDFAERFASLLGQDEASLGTLTYAWSKWWVARETGRRAIAWGPRGARTMSISPGMIYTPMALVEATIPRCGAWWRHSYEALGNASRYR